MKTLMTLAAAGAALALATPASAAIIVTPSPGAVQPDENVLSTTNMTGTTVMGTTNQTRTSVSVRSGAPLAGTETLSSMDSNGQARFAATDGSLDAATIFLTGGGSFTSAEFNLFNALAGTTSVTIFVNGVATTSSPFLLGNGQNFFGFQATAGDRITSIGFDTNGTGVVDLRQVRLGGVTMTAVPEPGTWAMMLLGFGAIGASMRRNRRRSTAKLMQMA
ncbi:PEPxxWA-CTERM sorting domain-containing protein [Sphingomonas glaciei]|uniref:PEPxxWA-CTERM sorting domain-containing protein n=1 Tax=Sphingomonas glaciei TaxID=2938948 RepID=A0ABY5MWT7_9SPHN|nr:PEPxxWA-CTERM sorting domain-containing protein [Sphingomonas glaciei]UUR08235.1 PEPxxWA-CTERM sorting domain-containing protein [Sphingomonas glaciei]